MEPRTYCWTDNLFTDANHPVASARCLLGRVAHPDPNAELRREEPVGSTNACHAKPCLRDVCGRSARLRTGGKKNCWLNHCRMASRSKPLGRNRIAGRTSMETCSLNKSVFEGRKWWSSDQKQFRKLASPTRMLLHNANTSLNSSSLYIQVPTTERLRIFTHPTRAIESTR